LSDLKRRGLLLVMGEPHPVADAEFNRWYDEEHLKERIACPGFLGARRFRAVEGTPRYLALYELGSLEALETQQYLHVANNDTPWTTRMRGQSGNWIRNVYAEITAPGLNTRSWR
jgi:hypothetical protein